MDALKELSENPIVLVICQSADYNDSVVSTVKQIAGKNNICYLTMNKTFESLKETFDKKKINTKNIVFIDAISRTIKDGPNQTAGCYFVSSPASLTELSILLDKLVAHDFKYFIFDSLTSLLFYQKGLPVTRFAQHFVNRVRNAKAAAVLYALDIPEHKEVLMECGMFVDKVIEDKK